MMRDNKPIPAIGREIDDIDLEIEIVRELYNTVSFTRGLGDSGYKLQLVEHECPACNYDRMLRQYRVNPESPSRMEYWCTSPRCSHYVGDTFSYVQSPVRPTTMPVTTGTQTEL